MTGEKTATLPAWLHWTLLVGGAAVGLGLALWLGAPGEWKDRTPELLVLTLTCLAASYALLVAWEKELTDGADVAVIKRIIELGTPAILLGGTWTSVGLTLTEGGTSKIWALLGMFLVSLLVILVMVWAAKCINQSVGQTSDSNPSATPEG